MVLYDPDRKKISVRTNSRPLTIRDATVSEYICPLCKQRTFRPGNFYVAENYFDILRDQHPDEERSTGEEGLSRGRAVVEDEEMSADGREEGGSSTGLSREGMNPGYYNRFFFEEKKIGSGGFGAVYLVRHVLHGINLGEYAMKRVPVGDNRPWLMRVLREVRMLENLNHPNVVQYKHSWLEEHRPADFGPKVPCLFILMEYCNGGNLADYVARATSRPHSYLHDDAIWSFLIDVSLGLRHLHHAGIIHRDLKAQNLLLHSTQDMLLATKETHLLISDFGQCQYLQEAQGGPRTGATGTVEYMAPELLETDAAGRHRIDFNQKSDMWSLGVILYLLCFSKLPFCADDVDATVKTILEPAPIEVPSLPARSPELVRLVMALLQRSPSRRPDIDEFLALAPVLANIQRLKRAHLLHTAPPRSASMTRDADPLAVSSLIRKPPVFVVPDALPAPSSPASHASPRKTREQVDDRVDARVNDGAGGVSGVRVSRDARRCTIQRIPSAHALHCAAADSDLLAPVPRGGSLKSRRNSTGVQCHTPPRIAASAFTATAATPSCSLASAVPVASPPRWVSRLWAGQRVESALVRNAQAALLFAQVIVIVESCRSAALLPPALALYLAILIALAPLLLPRPSQAVNVAEQVIQYLIALWAIPYPPSPSPSPSPSVPPSSVFRAVPPLLSVPRVISTTLLALALAALLYRPPLSLPPQRVLPRLPLPAPTVHSPSKRQ